MCLKTSRTFAKTLMIDLAKSTVVSRNRLLGCRPRKKKSRGLWSQRRCRCLEKEGRVIQPKEHHPYSETQRWEFYTVRMLQCIWNRESCQGGRNREEGRICEGHCLEMLC